MKSKINTSFKLLATLLLTFTCLIFVNAQQRSPQNIRRVTVTSQYVLDKGNKTDKIWVVYQEMFDSLGRLHTEIEWNFVDHQPHNYFWHTFKGKQRVKTEIFENEKLQMVKEFSYNKDTLVSQEIIKRVKPGDTSVYQTLSYKYNLQKKPVQIESRTPDTEIAYTSKFTYDLKGTEVTRKVKVKKGILPLDSIITMSCKPRYDSIGRLIGNLITIVKIGKGEVVKDFSYTYDKKNNITGISIRNGKGGLISREERIFQPSKNRLSQIKYYDSSDKLIKWTEKRYEIYRTDNHWAREIDY